MKAKRRFKESWFFAALAAAIIVGEVVAWGVARHFGLRSNPLVVAFLSVGLVAAVVSVLYDGVDIG